MPQRGETLAPPSAGQRAGSIYEGFSPAGQHALAELRAAFQRAGFYAEKERRTEKSLRVYPERRALPPLLNPSIVSPRSGAGMKVDVPSAFCPIYSRGDPAMDRVLSHVRRGSGWTLAIDSPPRKFGVYRRHGWVLVPLRFVGAAGAQGVEWDALVPPLAELHGELLRASYMGGADLGRAARRGVR